MTNFSIIKYLPRRIALKKKDLSNVTLRIQKKKKKKKTAGSIGFIKKALCHEITPKFAQVQGNFINKNINIKQKKYTFITFK